MQVEVTRTCATPTKSNSTIYDSDHDCEVSSFHEVLKSHHGCVKQAWSHADDWWMLACIEVGMFCLYWTSLPGPVGWLMEVWTSKGKCRTCRTYFSTSIGLRMITPPRPVTQWNELRSCSISTIHHTRDDLYIFVSTSQEVGKEVLWGFSEGGRSLSKKNTGQHTELKLS